MNLIIGVGPNYEHKDGTIGIDILPSFNPDVVRDIKRGLPFDSNKFENVEVHHVLEHIQLNDDYIFVMNEIYRVLSPGGIVSIEVPHKDSEVAYESAEHTRFFSDNSFANFYHNPHASQMGYPLFSQLVSASRHDRDGHKDAVLRVLLKK